MTSVVSISSILTFSYRYSIYDKNKMSFMNLAQNEQKVQYKYGR